MTTKTKARPKVRVTEADFEKLAAIGRAARAPMPGASLLLEELERFSIVSDTDRRQKFVRLGSQVTYRDLVLQRERTVRVGLPGEANVDENRISVLAPVGAALMGLSVGDVFRWSGVDEKPREIEVLKIED
ncbi:MAG: GreA/GreB family elongation factor [Pseudomonadota bacterium]|uniref:GreA/GreB family elongation factor n=1 Tax=Phenylobacterium sp. TaxID=1871053 RepID=UPI0025FA037C|nr:GreA/GreB family elongation factor [Phenylobacterium sp.]MBT9473331.1 GreA/GreB family elongation factor [Phenylobacterium sp.]